jgi:serine/threonine protein phosphatase PrpC
MDDFMIFQANKNANTFVQGTSHRGNNLPCQDRTYFIEENGLYVMTLADGAGSKEFSHLGAEIVTQMTARILVDSFNEYIQKLEEFGKSSLEIEQNKSFVRESILDRLTKQLEDYALANVIPSVKELASTLLFCAVDYRNRFIIGHIGDGLIGATFLTQEDAYSMVLSEPENGAESNITFFVTDDKALDHFRIQSGVFSNLEAIYLMSDGVADVFYSAYEGLSDSIRQFATSYQGKDPSTFEQSLKKVLESQVAKESDDDLSINLFYVERLEDKDMPSNYYQSLLKSIDSKEKIFRLSPYAVALHQSLRTKKKDFNSADQVKEYIYG